MSLLRCMWRLDSLLWDVRDSKSTSVNIAAPVAGLSALRCHVRHAVGTWHRRRPCSEAHFIARDMFKDHASLIIFPIRQIQFFPIYGHLLPDTLNHQDHAVWPRRQSLWSRSRSHSTRPWPRLSASHGDDLVIVYFCCISKGSKIHRIGRQLGLSSNRLPQRLLRCLTPRPASSWINSVGASLTFRAKNRKN